MLWPGIFLRPSTPERRLRDAWTSPVASDPQIFFSLSPDRTSGRRERSGAAIACLVTGFAGRSDVFVFRARSVRFVGGPTRQAWPAGTLLGLRLHDGSRLRRSHDPLVIHLYLIADPAGMSDRFRAPPRRSRNFALAAVSTVRVICGALPLSPLASGERGAEGRVRASRTSPSEVASE